MKIGKEDFTFNNFFRISFLLVMGFFAFNEAVENYEDIVVEEAVTLNDIQNTLQNNSVIAQGIQTNMEDLAQSQANTESMLSELGRDLQAKDFQQDNELQLLDLRIQNIEDDTQYLMGRSQ